MAAPQHKQKLPELAMFNPELEVDVNDQETGSNSSELWDFVLPEGQNNSSIEAIKEEDKNGPPFALTEEASEGDDGGDEVSKKGAKEEKEIDSNDLLDVSGVDQRGSRTDAIRYFLEHVGVSEPAKFEDPTTAAYQALQWIGRDDPAQLVVPGFDTTPTFDDWVYLEEIFQRYALAVLYIEMQRDKDDKAFNTASEEELKRREEFDSKWLSRLSVCEWPGVECHQHHVVALDLANTLLHGNLPSEIVDGVTLARLRRLDLSHNQIRGSLPSIPVFKKHFADKPSIHALQRLKLGHNQFAGGLQNLARLTGLSTSNMSSNSTLTFSLNGLSRLFFPYRFY